ncbi:MAG: MBL fold metallo-hydrolase [Parcubacteria group bacterium]|nr:MBL fold metallo-hydrolase [Parcubacteria group bacterium]
MLNAKKNIKLYLLFGLLILNIFIWSVIFGEESEILRVAFLDVGQGDAVFIQAPNGNQVLIDSGVNKKVLRELGKVMPFYDRSIDMLIATHPDKDHIGGFPDILKRYKVDFLLHSGRESESAIYGEVVQLTGLAGVRTVEARRGMVVVLDDDVHLNILFPDREVPELESNTASVIAQLVYGETEFMLTGDSPKAIENYLVMLDGESLESDVLKVGHHGSKTSSANAFIGFVQPKYSVISAGKDNKYGHPHEEVLETLGQFGSAILSTQDKGLIVFESDGENVFVR